MFSVWNLQFSHFAKSSKWLAQPCLLFYENKQFCTVIYSEKDGKWVIQIVLFSQTCINRVTVTDLTKDK